jgi:hypothetical protein
MLRFSKEPFEIKDIKWLFKQPTEEEKFKERLYNNCIKESDIRFFFQNQPFDWTSIQKFDSFMSLYDNLFMTDIKKEAILDTFCIIQRFSNAINRLKFFWKLKKAKVYNTDDLYMNPIAPGDKNVIVLMQNNTKYVFHLRELISGIKTSLSHCCHFFPDPIVCKNPYTNLPLNKSALYNIYFAVKSSSYIMPVLFHKYFLSNFNYYVFSLNNECLINEEFLHTYVENHCLENVREVVSDMFEIHKMKCKVHKEFPNNTLYTIMKPYLKLFYTSNYSMNKQKKQKAFRILHMKLHEFIQYNPSFGKRKVRMVEVAPFSKVKRCVEYFDENHLPFYDKKCCKTSSQHFMNTHLENTPVSHTEYSNHSATPILEEDSDSENEEEEGEVVIVVGREEREEGEEREEEIVWSDEDDSDDSDHRDHEFNHIYDESSESEDDEDENDYP